MRSKRGLFFAPEEIARAVRKRVEEARRAGEAIDYLTFVADGEPTLDGRLQSAIDLIKPLGIRVAVITNASLIWRGDVRDDLMRADWVSLKVDAVSEGVWRRINRPHKSLELAAILDGMLEFASAYGGELATETMLIRGVNDEDDHIQELARFLGQLRPAKAYLAIPTRPPAEAYVRGPDEASINRVYQTLCGSLDCVEYLIGYEGNAFAFTGHAEQDLLSITAVHPLRREAVAELLARAGENWDVVRRLVIEGKLIEVVYKGRAFYIRKFLTNVGSG